MAEFLVKLTLESYQAFSSPLGIIILSTVWLWGLLSDWRSTRFVEDVSVAQGRRVRDGLLVVALISSLTVGATQAVLEPRWSIAVGAQPEIAAAGEVLNRLGQAVVICSAFGACVSYFVLPRDRVRRLVLLSAIPLLFVWVAAAALLGSYASSELWVSWSATLSVVLLLSDREVRRDHVYLVARAGLRTLLILSLLAFAVQPEWAMAPGSDWPGGWAVGEARLSGVMAQPNMMGWLAALALAAEIGRRVRVPNAIFGGLALLAILLSGSRSATIGVCVLLFVALVSRLNRQPLLSLAAFVAGGAGFLQLLPALMRGEGETSTRFNGRELTWQLAMDGFASSPLIGQGPGWSPEGMGGGFYAHNQFLHSAAELGLLGLLAIASHLIALAALWSRCVPYMKGWLAAIIAMWVSSFVVENLLRIAILNFSVIAIVFLVLVSTAPSGCDGTVSMRDEADETGNRTRTP